MTTSAVDHSATLHNSQLLWLRLALSTPCCVRRTPAPCLAMHMPHPSITCTHQSRTPIHHAHCHPCTPSIITANQMPAAHTNPTPGAAPSRLYPGWGVRRCPHHCIPCPLSLPASNNTDNKRFLHPHQNPTTLAHDVPSRPQFVLASAIKSPVSS